MDDRSGIRSGASLIGTLSAGVFPSDTFVVVLFLISHPYFPSKACCSCDFVCQQAIPVLSHPPIHSVAFDPDRNVFALVCRLGLLAMFVLLHSVRMAPCRLVRRRAVPEQQCPLAHVTVLVPIDPTFASVPNRTPLAIVLQSLLRRVRRRRLATQCL